MSDTFDLMWPSLEATIRSLPPVVPTRAVKRSTDDMLAELLELVRAQASRGDDLALSRYALSAMREEAIRQSQRFLASLLDHVTRCEFSGDELHLWFEREQRSLAEMLQARGPMEKLRTIAGGVLGRQVRVVVKLTGAS